VLKSLEKRTFAAYAQRLKPEFGINIETCRAGGGMVQIIACIENAQATK